MSLMSKLKGQWGGDIDSVRDAIIENLSGLLSSKAPIWQGSILPPQSQGSIAGYGMVNLVRGQGRASSDLVILDVKQLIRTFEPRLKDVQVELDEESISTNKLKFRIEGVITSQFGEEVVVFDSSLDFTTSSLDVRKTNLV
ncbi:type VI secretion system baseplate subunit TssE [uncultured Photobacterium sp.]|uniref:type VI secretion system baseplate subunit TssE n=1 Tax=uncultured Photobacterium sp. TaxID=173973 RepID=UPI002613A7E0|nr:type VI secretion system baseplate subunit TssE [uncultured Photobacterium sp.]